MAKKKTVVDVTKEVKAVAPIVVGELSKVDVRIIQPIDKSADVQDNAQSVVDIIDEDVVSRDAIQLARKLSIQ